MVQVSICLISYSYLNLSIIYIYYSTILYLISLLFIFYLNSIFYLHPFFLIIFIFLNYIYIFLSIIYLFPISHLKKVILMLFSIFKRNYHQLSFEIINSFFQNPHIVHYFIDFIFLNLLLIIQKFIIIYLTFSIYILL